MGTDALGMVRTEPDRDIQLADSWLELKRRSLHWFRFVVTPGLVEAMTKAGTATVPAAATQWERLYLPAFRALARYSMTFHSRRRPSGVWDKRPYRGSGQGIRERHGVLKISEMY